MPTSSSGGNQPTGGRSYVYPGHIASIKLSRHALMASSPLTILGIKRKLQVNLFIVDMEESEDDLCNW